MPVPVKIRLTAALAVMLGLTGLAVAQSDDDRDSRRSKRNYTNTFTNNEDSDRCEDHVNIYSDDARSTLRAEETRTLPNQALNISASRNGGIHVRNWDKNEISIKVCKTAAARSESAARAMLDQIKLNVSGNTITVDGPKSNGDWDDHGGWSTVILVHVPVGATLTMDAYNGGISLKGVDGNFKALTHNGGVALVSSKGKLDVETTNGGITIKDCNGDVKANVRNGGMHIELAETWQGAGLEAHTQNGGLVVAVPKGMQSGVQVSVGRHSGVVCQADACGNGERTWDDDGRIIRFGSGNVIIRASTVNGGTVIKERGRNMGKL